MTIGPGVDVVDDLAHRILDAPRPVVLIDGGSGAGKSWLAEMLLPRLDPGTQLVTLDDVYPGWHGLLEATQMLPRILDADDPGYTLWNWTDDRPAGWVSLDPTNPLVVEGCGAITPESSVLATMRIWCELDAAIRKERALARDGDAYRPWWDTWAAQEAEHWQRHRPRQLADVVLPML